MYKYIYIISLLLSCNLGFAQNIYTALRLNTEKEYKTKMPKKIIETNTFYNSSGKKVDKNIKKLDLAGMIISEERFDEDGKLIARLTYSNDTTKRLKLSRTFERWSALGYQKETTFYTYDTNKCLIRSTDVDARGNIFQVSELSCNQNGYPIELLLYYQGNYMGSERANYIYAQNKVAVAVFSSNQSNALSMDTLTINFNQSNLYPTEDTKYNENGDLIAWERKYKDGSIQLIEEEYVYDKYGNIIENIIYLVVVKKNGKKKKNIDRIFRKEYEY
jgi:hypothetical protein